MTTQACNKCQGTDFVDCSAVEDKQRRMCSDCGTIKRESDGE